MLTNFKENYLEQLCAIEYSVMSEIVYICIAQSPTSFNKYDKNEFFPEGSWKASQTEWVIFLENDLEGTTAFQVTKVA